MSYIAIAELIIIIGVIALILLKRTKVISDWWLFAFFLILAINDFYNVLHPESELHVVHLVTITLSPVAFRLHLHTLFHRVIVKSIIIYLVPFGLLTPLLIIESHYPESFVFRFYLFAIFIILIIHGVIAILQSNTAKKVDPNKLKWSKWLAWCYTSYFIISMLSGISVDDTQEEQNNAFNLINDILSLSTASIITFLGYKFGVIYPGAKSSNSKVINKSDQVFYQDLFNKIDDLVTNQKLYLQNDLTLVDLCKELVVNQKYLSQAINIIHKGSFNQYINEKRIAAFEEKLQEPIYKNYSLAALSNECGFSSASSFNRIYKSIKGITPSEYKRSI